jgi:hypothetical protein
MHICTLHVRIHSCHYDVLWLNCDWGGKAIFTVRKIKKSSRTVDRKRKVAAETKIASRLKFEIKSFQDRRVSSGRGNVSDMNGLKAFLKDAKID